MTAWKSRNGPQATIAETNEEINRCRLALGLAARAPIFNAQKANKELDSLKAMLTTKGLAIPPAATTEAAAASPAVVAPVIEKLAEAAPAVLAPIVAEEKLSLDVQCRNRKAGKTLSPEIESITAEIASSKPGLRRDCLQSRLDQLTAPKSAATAIGGSSATIADLEARISNTPDGLTKDCLIARLATLKK